MAPRRSALYIPGSNLRALEKAKALPADTLILDLEDAVAPESKEIARRQIAEAVLPKDRDPPPRPPAPKELIAPRAPAAVRRVAASPLPPEIRSYPILSRDKREIVMRCKAV